MPDTLSIVDELVLHQKQREKGYSTLSVLIGPLGVGIFSWTRFSEIINRTIALISSIDRNTIIHSWFDAYQKKNSLLHAAIHALAQIKNIEPQELKNSLASKSQSDRMLFVDNLFINNPRRDLAEACKVIVADMNRENEIIIDRYVKEMLRETRFDWWSQLKTIHDLAPSFSPAVIFLYDSTHDNDPDLLSKMMEIVTHLVEAIPECPISFAISELNYKEFVETIPESKAKAIFQESVIRLQTVSSQDIRERVEKRFGENISRFNRTIDALAQDGASDELVETFLDTLDPLSQSPATILDEDRARSQAERLLYTRLETIADTTGIFVLNGRVPIPFGSHRAMEVDLVSFRYRIAIEIDGYYHFNDLEAYRRDRRKDFALQQHGYFVLRFLPDDVALELDVVLSRIRQVLSERKEIFNESPIEY